MSNQLASWARYLGAPIGFCFVASACEGQDLYRESHGRGNYRITSRQAFPGCEGEPRALPDARCVQVLPTLDGLWLQNCNAEQEQLDLAVELTRQGTEYGLTRIDIESCVDYCAGGVSTGCTSNCPGGRSCDATAFVYEATLDLERRRLHLELTRRAEVRLPAQENGLCDGNLIESSALEAPCSNIDAIEAVWESSQD